MEEPSSSARHVSRGMLADELRPAQLPHRPSSPLPPSPLPPSPPECLAAALDRHWLTIDRHAIVLVMAVSFKAWPAHARSIVGAAHASAVPLSLPTCCLTHPCTPAAGPHRHTCALPLCPVRGAGAAWHGGLAHCGFRALNSCTSLVPSGAPGALEGQRPAVVVVALPPESQNSKAGASWSGS